VDLEREEGKMSKRVFIFNFVVMSMLIFPRFSAGTALDNRVILYYRGGDIYVANIDGSNERQLTSGTPTDWMSSVSPDGTTIAFSRDYDLYLMNHDGTNQRLLVSKSDVGNNNVHSSDWTIDGEWIYFNAISGCCSGGIYKVRPDGTGLTMVKSGYITYIHIRDSFGDKLIFNQRRNSLSYSQNVRITDLDGGGEEQVTGGGPSEGSATFGTCWSPNGQRFAYNYGHQHIYVADYPSPYNPVEIKTFGTWKSHSLEWLDNNTLIWIDAYDSGPMHTINVDTLVEADLGINGAHPYVGYACEELGPETWWDDSWNYRKQLAITNTVGTILYDYSMEISLNTADLISQGKMQGDCGDIRIIENGTEINYGIKNPNSASTEIYFIANDLIVGDNNDIYIYYGNPEADNGFVENWKDAFYIWWDDFDTDRGWYDYWGRGGYYTVSDGYMAVYFSPYRDGAYAPADGSSFPMDKMPGLKAETKMMVLNSRSCQGQIVLGGWDFGSGGFPIPDISAGHNRYAIGYSGLISKTINPNQWYTAEFVYNRLTGDWYGTLNGELVSGNRPALGSDDFSTILVADCFGNNPRVDYIYLRYFIEPEPSYSLGPEEYAEIKVAVDIKPGSCPNPLNVKSKGVLPVAILGTEDFDVNAIDVASIRLEGVASIRSSYEDVAAPVWDRQEECECTTEGPDGYIDLTLKFKTQGIVATLGEVEHKDELLLTLEGELFEELGGTPIVGADCITIRGKYKPFNEGDLNKDGVVNLRDFAIFTENWLQSSIIED